MVPSDIGEEMGKSSKISGFPEWLPEQKLAEERVVAVVRRVYESYGFTPIETPAVELISTLASKGVIDKEIFAVKRLKAEDSTEAEMGLHFDLTVPFARYVAQHSHALVFPFKRYQLQKVWRGDRPQKGRFREFYQFDCDMIARDTLPLSCDAEILSIIGLAMQEVNLGSFQIRVSNRKLLTGLYSAIGVSDDLMKSAITAVDKLNKIGREGVEAELAKLGGLSPAQIGLILASTDIQCAAVQLHERILALGVRGEAIDRGVEEIVSVAALVPERVLQHVTVDLSLARGLDYYSGLILEVGMKEFPEFGTVAAGGRYDELASEFTNEKLPGVGASIGLTRLMELAFSQGLVDLKRRSPTVALVAVYDETDRMECTRIADILRSCGLPTEVYFKSPKLGKQIEYAEAKGVRFVLFVDVQGSTIQVKDLVTKEQTPISSLQEWAHGVRALFE
jgi:histidyl-tRNA synthetase